jgi:arylsulfatase A
MENAKAWGFDEMVTWRNYHTPDRYWDPNLYVNGVKKSFPGKYGPDVMQDSIFAFIDKIGKESPEKPFFVYYATPLPHGPMVHTPDSTSGDISLAEKYRDMVLYMDKQIGDLRGRLEKRNLAGNTLIIFTGDNGSDAPMKEIINGKAILGSKGRMNDGGVWVPWICYWPAAIESGQQTDTLVDFSDFFPTLLEVAGIEAPENLQLDGQSFAPVMRGKRHAGRDWVFFQRNDNYAVRDRKWKLNEEGTLFDMSLAPHQEITIDPAATSKTQAAYDRLSKALAVLNPRGGSAPSGNKPEGHPLD